VALRRDYGWGGHATEASVTGDLDEAAVGDHGGRALARPLAPAARLTLETEQAMPLLREVLVVPTPSIVTVGRLAREPSPSQVPK